MDRSLSTLVPAFLTMAIALLSPRSSSALSCVECNPLTSLGPISPDRSEPTMPIPVPTNWEFRFWQPDSVPLEGLDVRLSDQVRLENVFLACSAPETAEHSICTAPAPLAPSTTFNVYIRTTFSEHLFEITTSTAEDLAAPGPVEIIGNEWIERGDGPFSSEPGPTRGVRLTIRAPEDAAMFELEILEDGQTVPAILPARIEERGEEAGVGSFFVGQRPCVCLGRLASNFLSDAARLRIRAIDAAGNEGPWTDEGDAVFVQSGCSATNGQPSSLVWMLPVLAALLLMRRCLPRHRQRSRH